MYAVFFHAHQKIDRVARQHLSTLDVADQRFPGIREILHFEGQNGPDSTKLKKLGTDQPWHFINPFNEHDVEILQVISEHYRGLVAALKSRNEQRAAFEAAWLAHALVDGLTPAHHYPYEMELQGLRGERRETRSNLRERTLIKGTSLVDSVRLSYKLVGPKGLLLNHTSFEGGAFAIIAPLKLQSALPSAAELAEIKELGVTAYFLRTAKEVAAMDLYVRFQKWGWTTSMAREVRRELAPRMVRMVTLAWYSALIDAGLMKEPL
jgi:hypothetical protein